MEKMKKTVNIFFICLVALICCQTNALAISRSDKLKPKWVTHALPESKSRSYIFVRAHGQGASLAGAKQQAFVSMSQKLEVERGLTVNTNVKIREQLSQTQSLTNSEYLQEITLDVIENGRELKIVCREIDEYWEISKGLYEVDILYTVTNKNALGGSFDDKIVVTSNYGVAGFLSIIPSVGQFYKGSVVKGSIILAGEIAAVGGILLCENTRASYKKMMIEQPKHASEYNTLCDKWETGRNIAIGAAAAIYVYNLIDAFASIGAKRVVVQSGNMSLSTLPYFDKDVVGISLALKF